MYRTRRYFSEVEVWDLWERWRSGETLTRIASALDREKTTVRQALAINGGCYRPPRRRRDGELGFEQREEISRGLAARETLRQIAVRIGVSASTVSREVARNGGPASYRAAEAEQAAWERAKRPKTCLLAQRTELRSLVTQKLQERWAPEQITGWLEDTFPADNTMRVSHETIYRTLFIQSRGALRRDLTKHLRSRRSLRRPKACKGRHPGPSIADAVSIRERPAEVEDRAVPGHWEGDLVFGGRNSQIATLVERHSRFVMLVKLDGKDTRTVVDALTAHVHQLPAELMRSLTWDRGLEMAAHKDFTVATDVKVYFCDPQSPWQRGSNENTNGLLRQYLPHKMDFKPLSQADLDEIARSLNTRPRKTLGFKTPAFKLAQAVASTG